MADEKDIKPGEDEVRPDDATAGETAGAEAADAMQAEAPADADAVSEPKAETPASPRPRRPRSPPSPSASPGRRRSPTPRRRPTRRTRTSRPPRRRPPEGEEAGPQAEAEEGRRRRAAGLDQEGIQEGRAPPGAAPRRDARAPRRPCARPLRAHRTRKARLVCDHIRGKSVEEARAILAYATRAAARDWAKLLESAVANAENNHELVADDLHIVEVYADEGPTLKRFRPRAMGRATRIRKRTSHLTIALSPKDD